VSGGRPGEDDERGAGTVLLLAVAAVVVLVALAIAALGAAQRARGVAQSAADLGALAAATALRHGIDPCATAAAGVERNAAELAACEVEPGGVVRVTTERAVVGPDTWIGALLGEASAQARAGSATVRSG
jgi:secretion/DNA translocation related TadE-like protein